MKKKFVALLISALVSVSVSFADGDSRSATQEEKDFTLRVMQTLDHSIPDLPSGWVVESKSEIVAPVSVTADAEKYPLQVEYQQYWQHPEKLEEYRIKEAQMIDELAASMQKDQNKMADTSRKLDALAAELTKALQNNDAAEVSRIQGQMDEVAKQLNEVGEAQSKTIEARQQEIKPKDAKVEFRYRVNATNYDISRYKKDVDIAGLQTYRYESDDPNASLEGDYVIFVGDFAPKAYESETWMELTTDPAVPSASVQSVILRIAGDKTHARRLLESMDWAALRAMVKK